jgi:hypothetical protein
MTLPKPSIEPHVTVGNIISWAMIVIGIVVGYTKLTDASAQNQKDVYEAKSLALQVQSSLITSDSAKSKEISEIRTDVAVIKSNVLTISDKIDDIRRNQK